MVNFWFIFLILLITCCVGLSIYLLSNNEKTTKISSGNFSSLIGNEIIRENINLKKYVVEAQNKVSKIIKEDIEIPLIIRSYPLGDGILAQAKMNNKFNIRSGGVIVINNIRLTDPERWTNIIVHEILHILGIGTSDKWDDSVITIGSEKFLDRSFFPNSSRQYDNLVRRNLISGVIGSPIPLSDGNDSYPDGGAHLDEIVFDTEVMTPIADKVNVVSSLSIAMLDDLGFEIDYSENEDYLL